MCKCLQTLGQCKLSLAELAVWLWLQICGNDEREGKEQNLEVNADSKTIIGKVQMMREVREESDRRHVGENHTGL